MDITPYTGTNGHHLIPIPILTSLPILIPMDITPYTGTNGHDVISSHTNISVEIPTLFLPHFKFQVE